MTAYADEFTAIAQRTQDATSTAVRSWTESMKSYTEHITAENPLPQPGDVHAILDTWYDLASKLVAEQRRFVKTVVDAGTEAAGAVTEQARAAASAVPVAPFTVPTPATAATSETVATPAAPAAPKRTRTTSA